MSETFRFYYLDNTVFTVESLGINGKIRCQMAHYIDEFIDISIVDYKDFWRPDNPLFYKGVASYEEFSGCKRLELRVQEPDELRCWREDLGLKPGDKGYRLVKGVAQAHGITIAKTIEWLIELRHGVVLWHIRGLNAYAEPSVIANYRLPDWEFRKLYLVPKGIGERYLEQLRRQLDMEAGCGNIIYKRDGKDAGVLSVEFEYITDSWLPERVFTLEWQGDDKEAFRAAVEEVLQKAGAVRREEDEEEDRCTDPSILDELDKDWDWDWEEDEDLD